MSKTLQVSCVQLHWAKPLERNLERTLHYIRMAAEEGSRVVLFPETNVTGYYFPQVIKQDENKVQAALDEVMKGRTTFVIAHRLATIRNATRILVFEGGQIIESGSFDELVRKGGHFADLARTQIMIQDTAKQQVERNIAT